MLILDTNHHTVLAKDDPTASALRARLGQSGQGVGTSAVSVEEVLRGWLAKIASQGSATRQVPYYGKLQSSVETLGQSNILPFDTDAAEQFEQLRILRLGIGTMDLKIAATVIVNRCTLLSANLRDFERVLGLKVEDWIGD